MKGTSVCILAAASLLHVFFCAPDAQLGTQSIQVAKGVQEANVALAPNPNPLYVDVMANQPDRPEKHHRRIDVNALQAPRREKNSDDLWKLQLHYQKVPVDQFAIHKVAELPNYINVFPKSVSPPDLHRRLKQEAKEERKADLKQDKQERKADLKQDKQERKGDLKQDKKKDRKAEAAQIVDKGKGHTHPPTRPQHHYPARSAHGYYPGYGRNSMGRPVIPVVVTDDTYRQFPGVTFITTLFTQTLTLVTPTSVTQSVTSTGFATIATTYNVTLSSASSSSVTSDTPAVALTHLFTIAALSAAVALLL